MAAAVDQATGLLQRLALDPTAKAPNVPKVNEKAPATAVVAAVANQKPVMEWSGTPRMQDYKEATMYYGAYPTYVYAAYGGWGSTSTYLSHDGAGTPTPDTYGDMYYVYSLYDCSTSGYDGQMYGSQASQHCQYPSTYDRQQDTAAKPSYNGKTEDRPGSIAARGCLH